MTEALKTWVASRTADDDCDWNAHPLSVRTAEFWLRAFCIELKDRADNRTGTVEECFYDAFQQLKRELLED